MLNDETQEDVTSVNNVEEVEETVEEETQDADESTDVEAELAKARAEAKKWEAIAKRKAKRAEETVKTDAPQALDQELINLTYKNYLGGLGITHPDVQDEAISLAKRMGVAVSQIQSDPAIMEILQTKQKIAVTNKAIAKGTGGAATRKKDVDYLATKVANGGTIDSISGKDAVALLRKLKGN
jgi:hypothetical protein